MKVVLFLILIGFSSQSFAQNDCEHFRVGKFQNIEDGVLRATIVRNDSIQVERYGNKMIKLQITWLDDCSYQLTFLEGNQAFWDARPPNMPTEDLIVRITKIHGNSYTQESKFANQEDFTYISEIEKIEQ